MSAPLILAVDTAGPVAGLALLRGSQLEGSWCARVVRGAEARLVPAVQELLCGRQPDLVAVAAGPGGFTGLRVGVATAVGLASAWGCPVVPLSSLQTRAAMLPGLPAVLALLDARKGRFYGGLFDTREAVPVALEPERDVPLEQLLPASPCPAVGEGAAVGRAILLAAGCTLPPQPDANPAPALARLGLLMAERGHAVPAHAVALRYLRAPDAVPPKDVVAAREPRSR